MDLLMQSEVTMWGHPNLLTLPRPYWTLKSRERSQSKRSGRHLQILKCTKPQKWISGKTNSHTETVTELRCKYKPRRNSAIASVTWNGLSSEQPPPLRRSWACEHQKKRSWGIHSWCGCRLRIIKHYETSNPSETARDRNAGVNACQPAI